MANLDIVVYVEEGLNFTIKHNTECISLMVHGINY